MNTQKLHVLTIALTAGLFGGSLQPGFCDDSIRIPMPERSDGLNVIKDSTAVLIRPQIKRTDDLLRKDAFLNARLIFHENSKVSTVHALYGCDQTPHVYKRIDVDMKDAQDSASSGKTLKITSWNALNDRQLPGFTESRDAVGQFSEDPDHTRVGSMTIEGGFENHGTLVLTRTEEEVAAVKKKMKEEQALAAAKSKQPASAAKDPFDQLSKLKAPPSTGSNSWSALERAKKNH